MTKKPILIVSDLHFHNWRSFSTTLDTGVNSRLQHILDSLKQACIDLLKEGGTNCYIAGDVFHERGKIQPSVINPVIDTFEALIDEGIKFRVIPGNHDLESKHAERLTNANQALAGVGCYVCNEVTRFEDDKVTMFPWFNDLDDLREALQDNADPERIAIIHAPCNEVIKGIPDTGLDADELEAFGYKYLFSGHYHNAKQLRDTVYSIGALTHQTWGDIDTICGFLLYEPEIDALSHSCHNIAPRFVDFDPTVTDGEQEGMCEGNFVRWKLSNYTDEADIEAARQHLLKLGAEAAIVEAVPKSREATRTTSIKAGASVEASIAEWIDKNIDEVDPKELYKECEKVLQEVAL